MRPRLSSTTVSARYANADRMPKIATADEQLDEREAYARALIIAGSLRVA